MTQLKNPVFGNYIGGQWVAARNGATFESLNPARSGGAYDQGYFVSPAVFAEVTPGMRIAREEIFGPVVSLPVAPNFDRAVEMTNDSDYGLVASIWTRDLAKARAFGRDARVGVVKVNRPTTGVPLNAPFGGVKLSSSDTVREQGRESVEFYTRIKTVDIG